MSRGWLGAVALVMVAGIAALFWPGYLSWDSAYQWWQARHDQFDATHPPLMAMIWQLTDRWVPGPGGLFLLQLALLWGALALFVAALPLRPWLRVLVLLGIGLWPPLLGLQVHLWKDLWTLAGFVFATALLAWELRAPSTWLRGLALLAVVLACAFRHNAITGALPILLWLVIRQWPDARLWQRCLQLAALTAITLLLAALPARDSRVKPVDSVWSVVTLWDAAGVSLREGALVFPPELVAPDLTLADLREHFSDYSNTTVYGSGKLKHSFDGPYSDAQRDALHALAWQLPTQHTAAYLAHRWRLAQLLFGLDQAGLPDDQVLMPGIHQYGDNPPLTAQRSALHDTMLRQLWALIDTPLFAGWCYLAASLAVLLFALLRRAAPEHGLAAVLAASALCYALPLALVSGSAEFRYLAWPVWSALAAPWLFWRRPRAG